MSSSSNESPTIRGALATALRVGALLCSLYLLTFSAAFRLDDEHILAARAQSLALRGSLDEPQVYGNQRVRELAAMGDPATAIEPLHTLLSAGLYRAAIGAGLGGTQATFLLNLYLTAFSAVVLSLTVSALGFPAATAGWCGLLFGAGTIASVYATALVRDTLAMAMVSVALLGAVLSLRAAGRARAFGLALLAGGMLLGLLAKNTVVAYGVGFALGAAAAALPGLRAARIPIRRLALPLIALIVLAAIWSRIPASGPLARYSLAYYRSLLEHFSGSLDPGLVAATLGPFISPAKSIFLFSPPLLLALAGLRRGDRRLSTPILAGTLGLALAQALFYRQAWAGAVGWGLRYMLPAFPGLLLVAAPVVDRLRSGRRGWIALGIVLGGSMIIQAAGAMVDWRVGENVWREQGRAAASPASAWDVRFLAIPAQLHGLGDPSAWLPVWWRMRAAPGVLAAAAAVIAVLIGLSLLLALGRRFHHAALGRAGTALILAAAVLPIFPTLWLVRADPRFGGDRPEFAQALAAWSQGGRNGDLVVVDSYGTPLWSYFLNHWDSPVAWFSLPFEIPGSAELEALPTGELGDASRQLFGRLGTQGQRLWYFDSSEAPDYGLQREAIWLGARCTLLEQQAFSGQAVVELRIYVRGGP